MIFKTERLYIRQYSMEDFEDFCNLNTDEEVMRYIRPVKSRELTYQFFLENLAFYQHNPEYGRWALLDRNTSIFMGSFMLRPSTVIQGEIELGYAFCKRHWGQGYASEAVIGGLHYAFKELNLEKVVAITQSENIASQKVLIKCGFSQLNDLEDNGRTVNLFRKIKAING
jgi:[ribosomal protein S5]-alanine N-acetyltransferase